MALNDYDPYFDAAGRKYNVDPRLLKSVAYVESRGDPSAVSPAGAQGLMQIMPATAKALNVDPLDPAQAIDAGARYISEGLDKYGTPEKALMYYHGGPNETGWGPKTSAYPGLVAQAYAKIGKDGQTVNQTAQPVDQLSDDALISAFGKSDESGTAHPVDGMSDDDLISAFKNVPLSSPVAVTTKATTTALPNGMTEQQAIQVYGDLDTARAAQNQRDAAMAGVVQGVENVPRSIIKTANYVLPQMGLGHPAELPFEQETQNRLAQFGSQPGFSSGRMAGNMLATAPFMAAGGAGIGAALGGLGRAVPALEPVTTFLGGGTEGASLLRYASRAANGALQGATATPLIAANTDQSVPDQLKSNALLGATVGAALPAAGDALRKVRNSLGAPSVSPEVRDLANRAEELGIKLRGSQISGNPLVKTADSVLTTTPLTGFAEQNAAQNESFQKAIAAAIGAPEGTTSFSPAVMSAAKENIGSVMNGVAQRTKINATQDLVDALARTEGEAGQVLADSELRPIRTQIDNILSKVDDNNQISGEAYQALTRKGAPLERALNSDNPNVKFYAGQIRDALDDALESSASPEDLAALQKARFQYKNLKTIEPLVAKSPTNQVSPLALNGVVNKSFKNRAFAGAGDLGDLADIGQRFLKEPPNSGTEQRMTVRKFLMNPLALATEGAVAGNLLSSSPHLAGAAAGGAALGLGTSNLAARVLGSDWYRNALLNGAIDNGAQGGLAGYLANPASNRLIPAAVYARNAMSR